FENALLLASRAEIVARNALNAGLLVRIQGRSQEIRNLKDEYMRIKPSLKTLEEKPDDPAANLLAGLYRCFARGEWGRGLPMLAKGSDAGLASVAQAEIAGA